MSAKTIPVTETPPTPPPQTMRRIVPSVPSVADTGSTNYETPVEWCVWGLGGLSEIIVASSVTWKREKNILYCTFRNKRGRPMKREACQFTQRPIAAQALL